MELEKSVLKMARENNFPKNLDKIVLNDEEYQKLSQQENDALTQLWELAPNPEIFSAIDNVLTASSACAARYNVIAYEQGFLDCLTIYKELKT